MRRTLLMSAVLAFLACNRTDPFMTAGTAVTGAWGGEHVALTLSDSGGSVEYDCAHGGLTAALRPGGGGAFDVPGVHVREHGGPMREGEIPDSITARYVGTVKGEQMTLRVIAGGDTLGPFALQRNAEARLMRCL